jgi:hypothetical protein
MTEKDYKDAIRVEDLERLKAQQQGREYVPHRVTRKEYTMSELKYIHDRYVREGGFVGLRHMRTPLPVQEYVYNLMSTGSYMNFFNDIRILLSRSKHKGLYESYMRFYDGLKRYKSQCSECKRSKGASEHERIHEELRTVKCYAGLVETKERKSQPTSRILDILKQRINDQSRTPEQRESARTVRDNIMQIYEKREVIWHCPALCLMELARATATGSDRALELTYRYINRRFWIKEAFCREAVKINAESLDWVYEKWRNSCQLEMEHDRLIASLKRRIKAGIDGDGEVELYFPYPRHIPKSDPQGKLILKAVQND